MLPEQPSLQEIETYLTMMGHFGAETGYPAIRVTVAGPDVLQAGANQDFLVITTGQSNGAVGKLAGGMPVTFGDNSLKVQDTRGFFSTFHNMWWKIPATDQLSSGEIGTTGVPDALIEEIESPYASGRTVVLVDVKSGANTDPMLKAFLESSQSSAVSGTVALLRGNAVRELSHRQQPLSRRGSAVVDGGGFVVHAGAVDGRSGGAGDQLCVCHLDTWLAASEGAAAAVGGRGLMMEMRGPTGG